MQNKIIKLIKKKNEKAIDYLCEQYSDKVYYIASQILKGYASIEDIEECVSDTFLSVWNDIDEYDNRRGKFETFIYIKAKYKALDYKKKSLKIKENDEIREAKLIEIDSNLKHDSAENIAIKEEKRKEIIEFIKTFKEPDKTYFYLRYFMNFDIKQIAKKYNTTASSVESRLYRCRLNLRKNMDGGA